MDAHDAHYSARSLCTYSIVRMFLPHLPSFWLIYLILMRVKIWVQGGAYSLVEILSCETCCCQSLCGLSSCYLILGSISNNNTKCIVCGESSTWEQKLTLKTKSLPVNGSKKGSNHCNPGYALFYCACAVSIRCSLRNFQSGSPIFQAFISVISAISQEIWVRIGICSSYRML